MGSSLCSVRLSEQLGTNVVHISETAVFNVYNL